MTIVRPRHLYVHVPFCARRCAYCDFSIAVRRVVPVDEYLDALRAEVDLRYPRGEPWDVDTLYLGGGTPSKLGADGVARALDMLRARLALAPDAEVTLEANPEDVTRASLRAWRSAGVNRLSLGGQSFDDRVLAWMHRTHDARSVAAAVEAAREVGIDNLSLDLIFALPTSLDRSWESDIERALSLRPAHLSLYGLTVEPGTPLARWQERGASSEVPEDRYADEFVLAHERMTAAGYEHYEVSNFALPRARSRHNSSYWSGAPYGGIGPAAHEFDGSIRRWNNPTYSGWVRSLRARSDPLAGRELLDAGAREIERVYLGLRTLDGIELRESERDGAASWAREGWATVDDNQLRLTAVGWLRLDEIATVLTHHRSR